jgi:transcriptional regulator GlxA family with amidase domain
VRLCSLKPEVQTEHATLKIPWRLASVQQADTVIVPGIEDIGKPVPPAILRALQAAVKRGTRVASICTGAFLLARSGVLDGLRATTHWMVASELARRHPAISVDADVLYVDNGRILTSAGAAAGLDLCLHLIRCDLGAEIAARAARAAVMPLERAGGQAQFIVHEQPESTESLGTLLKWMEQNLRKQLPLPMIARHAGMSTRSLSRKFREQVGTTPAQWIAKARIRHAQHLLETTRLSIEQIATETGFQSTSVLREHFGAIVGTSPALYRRAFGRPAD